MALFKKDLAKSRGGGIFPQSQPATTSVVEAVLTREDVVRFLLENEEFMQRLQDGAVDKLLTVLQEKYDFMPTDKYLEEIANKQKYVGQLDQYLQDRREINNTVENELQMFLQETAANLSKSLDSFTLSIQQRIKQAQTRHGIDNIKQSLLSSTEDQG